MILFFKNITKQFVTSFMFVVICEMFPLGGRLPFSIIASSVLGPFVLSCVLLVAYIFTPADFVSNTAALSVAATSFCWGVT